MNDSKNSSNGLLVLRMSQVLTNEQVSGLTDAITPTADALGLEPMVLGNGADIRIENGRDALLERVCVALEEIAAQGRMPEVNVAENAPQALNARRTEAGLNSRPSGEAFIDAFVKRTMDEGMHIQPEKPRPRS